MVNPNIEGKRYARTSPYLVGREKVREFGRAVMAPSQLLDLVPATFPVVIQEQSLAVVLADPEAQIDFSRVVHGEQRFVYQRAIKPGDELTSELTVASVKGLGGNWMVTFETQIFDAENSPVCTAISTLVVRGEAA